MKKTEVSNSPRRLIIAVLFAQAALSACGNSPARSLPQVSKDAYSSVYASSTEITGCATQKANILASKYYAVPTGDFTVCESETNAFSIEIHGRIPATEDQVLYQNDYDPYTQQYGNEQICVFPAQFYEAIPSQGVQSRKVWKADNLGYPMVQCVKLSDSGAIANFDRTNYNSVFIVKGSDRDQMRQCLVSGNEYNCPAFAQGRFRK